MLTQSKFMKPVQYYNIKAHALYTSTGVQSLAPGMVLVGVNTEQKSRVWPNNGKTFIDFLVYASIF